MRFSFGSTATMRCHENAGRMDVVRIDFTGRDEMLDFGDRHLGGGCHHRIKVARGLAVNEVAGSVALPGVHNREIGNKTGFHDVLLAVELAHFLAFRNQSADAGLGIERGNARAAGADALGQRSLRIEFEFQFTGQVLLCEQLVLADIGRDHLLDLAGFQQPAQSDAVNARIVGNNCQILDAGFTQGVREDFGDTAKSETARHDHHAVLENTFERGFRVGKDLVHCDVT